MQMVGCQEAIMPLFQLLALKGQKQGQITGEGGPRKSKRPSSWLEVVGV
jgi:hypothetical protein